MFEKRIAIYDGENCVIHLNTPQPPTQIRYFPISTSNAPLIAVCEYNQVTVWDVRSNNPCIKRLAVRSLLLFCILNPSFVIQPSNLAFYAMDIQTDSIAASGGSRNVHIYDAKKWSQSGSWSGCLKYEVTSLHFSTEAPLCYVGGLDSAVSN
jgi:hypothetical protein